MDIFSDEFLLTGKVPEEDVKTDVQFQLAADLGNILEPEAASLSSNSKMNGLDLINETLSQPTPSANVNLLLDTETATVTPSLIPGNQEPDKLRKWKEEQRKRLLEKDAEEERQKQEMLKTAKKELEDWYKAHGDQVAKTKATNRNAEKSLEQGISGEKSEKDWACVTDMCNFGPRRGRDMTRMRSLLLQLKQSGARPKYPPRNNDS